MEGVLPFLFQNKLFLLPSQITRQWWWFNQLNQTLCEELFPGDVTLCLHEITLVVLCTDSVDAAFANIFSCVWEKANLSLLLFNPIRVWPTSSLRNWLVGWGVSLYINYFQALCLTNVRLRIFLINPSSIFFWNFFLLSIFHLFFWIFVCFYVKFSVVSMVLWNTLPFSVK